MVKRMLIDATHPEETRVVVVSGTRLEELDVETSTKKQLKGNIYLAKVVRVEPSLQAAFVDYGGNRHGFLAFSEIHPDYYQIPVADRQALLAEQKAVMAENGSEGGNAGDGEAVDVVGGDDVEEMERRRPRSTRNYKIQEVIKRRQIMLVQVVKEERGNKGAALTTYLSLAGRYCVLMPNTARGGGVSRKITNAPDRKRLKAIVNELEIPDGMAVIVRTAGAERTKAEIKRDYEYLLRAWDNVRELTLQSTAPALVYEEGNLIKRAIRDLYARDIDEVLVEGEDGYRAAKDFMRMLTPSHAKKVQPYREPTMPLFYRYQVESQLDAMHSPIVQLRSGGYIVISQTEALVAIDVNSGRSTKERHIEETALKTNLEAAEEIARQLRLRDLAGLIVIDFIDMEENRNNHAVERRLKEAMKHDRARIQLGRISPFGLLELSRQRLRPSLIETSFQPCTHCAGTGQVRSVESTAIYVLRAIEEEGIRRRSTEVTVTVPTIVALYILNQKRAKLAEIEQRYGFSVFVNGDDTLIPPNYRMDRVKTEVRPEEAPRPVEPAPAVQVEAEEEDEETVEEAAAAENRSEAAAEDQPGKRRRRRRKKKKRTEEPATMQAASPVEAVAAMEAADAAPAGETAEEGEEEDETVAAEGEQGLSAEQQAKRRRRGRRGGRRRRRETTAPAEAEVAAAVEAVEDVAGEPGEAEAAEAGEPAEALPPAEPTAEPVAVAAEAPVPESAPAVSEPAPEEGQTAARKPKRKPTARKAKTEEAAAEKKAPARTRARKAKAEPAATPEAAAEPEAAPEPAAAEAETKAKRPRRKKAAAAAAEPAGEAAVEAAVRPSAEPKAEPEVEPEVQASPAVQAAETAAELAEDGQPLPPRVEVITSLPEDAKPKRGWWRR